MVKQSPTANVASPPVEKAPPVEKRKVREGYDVVLPASYKGRCSGENARFTTLKSTFGQQNLLDEDAKFPRFEIRLPLPSTDEEARGMYNLSMAEIVEAGVTQLGYGLDAKLKKVLFVGIAHPARAIEVKPAQHLAAQKFADEWRYAPPERSSARTFKANEVEALLLQLGAITADEVGKLTKESLAERIKALRK